jgi:hypothetical protein
MSYLSERIKYPKQCTTYLQTVKKVTTFKIKDGGRYLQNNGLSKKQKVQITKLLTELVTLPKVNPKEHKTFEVIAPIIRRFAEGSRLKDGNRLCQRSVRHGTDPRQADIRLCKGHVFDEEEEQEDNIGLVLKHNVKASMKNDAYDVEVAFTCSDLIACSCTC